MDAAKLTQLLNFLLRSTSKVPATLKQALLSLINFAKTHPIIWNEIVMTHRHNFEAVDCTLRNTRQSTLPFGEAFLLCFEDFWLNITNLRAANRLQTGSARFKRT